MAYNRRVYTKEYFEDQAAIAKLNTKLIEAIPEGEYYHIAIMALTRTLDDMIAASMREEVMARWHPKEK